MAEKYKCIWIRPHVVSGTTSMTMGYSLLTVEEIRKQAVRGKRIFACLTDPTQC